MATLTVGRYELVNLLGEGGMGSVYEGHHLDTGQRVAVKLINADVAAHSSVLARFEIEARAAAAIQSPHVTRVLDFGRVDGAPYLVMEMLDGKDLETIFGEFRILAPDLVVRFAAQCCAGLQLAHDRGIVHRDIKPANLILAEREGSNDLVLKVLDFGIAKVRADEWQALSEEPLTRTGSLLGSPRYMSPEQARGYKTIDHRTDLFSLAVVMYQGLTGHTPHHKVEAMGDLIVTLCSDPAPLLRSQAAWIDPRLERIVARALSINVAERYGSATEMARDLNELSGERTSMTRAELRTFEPPPPSFSVGATMPQALPRVPAAEHPPKYVAAQAAPALDARKTADVSPDLREAPRPIPIAQAGTGSGEAPTDEADPDPFPMTWVAAGILLSLVVGIGSVAAGVIPFPSPAPTRSTDSASAAAPSGTNAAPPDPSGASGTPTSGPLPTATASATGAIAPAPSATVLPAVSAKPALTGHLPMAVSARPHGPSSAPVPSTSPPPSAPPVSHPSPPAPPQLPPDSPL